MFYMECSWGLSLFVLFELYDDYTIKINSSWGLSLFVLFELLYWTRYFQSGSWGLSLFVLFELTEKDLDEFEVLED